MLSGASAVAGKGRNLLNSPIIQRTAVLKIKTAVPEYAKN